jgi:hypothetical protein
MGAFAPMSQNVTSTKVDYIKSNVIYFRITKMTHKRFMLGSVTNSNGSGGSKLAQ